MSQVDEADYERGFKLLVNDEVIAHQQLQAENSGI
ncbi:hypothetical protein M948_19520 [Virgibacillus sp. CM-4]|nr:hypothetical protein M948_19520 [Virgibacillus sp. CM-4]